MAGTDLITITRNYTDPVTSVVTNGLEERITINQLLNQVFPTAGSAVVGATVTPVKQTAPAAAAVPFADLTAAANSFNALRTALINSGILG